MQREFLQYMYLSVCVVSHALVKQKERSEMVRKSKGYVKSLSV